jgi:hypothetical protein
MKNCFRLYRWRITPRKSVGIEVTREMGALGWFGMQADCNHKRRRPIRREGMHGESELTKRSHFRGRIMNLFSYISRVCISNETELKSGIFRERSVNRILPIPLNSDFRLLTQACSRVRAQMRSRKKMNCRIAWPVSAEAVRGSHRDAG